MTEYKKLKKNDLIKLLKKNDDYKQKFLELQEENFKLVIKMNDLEQETNRKIENIVKTENDDETIRYLKKRIKETTESNKKQKYINHLKKYTN